MKDYYAVMRAVGKSVRFVCHVLAVDAAEAMKTARHHGFKLPRGSYASRVGRRGYFSALAAAFGKVGA